MFVEKILVSEILHFIAELEQCTSCISEDDVAIQQLKERFECLSPNAEITTENKEQLLFFTNLFATRGQKLLDEPARDYTFSQTDANILWVNLGKKLGLVFDIPYIKIVFPQIENTTDLIGLRPLASTNNTTSFFIGDDDKTLFNKKSLCVFLMEHPSLIIKVNSNDKKILTIKELYRIQAQIPSEKSKFIIDNQHFISVWDFLEKIVFPMLNPEQIIPQPIMVDFFLLIDEFYKLKRDNAPISQFKQKLNLFLQKINLTNDDKTNLFYLYGLQINFNGKNHYFIHILIHLYQINNYDIEPYLKPVHDWLYSLNKMRANNEDYNQAVCYLISLFNNERYPGTELIKVGNLTRRVTAEVAQIYAKFNDAINNQEKKQIVAIFNELAHNDNSRSPQFFESKTDAELPLLRSVIKKTCSKIDAKYYPIELIIHAMFHYKKHNSSIAAVWDKVLHICCSDATVLTKQLQANIILTELLKNAEVEVRIELLLCLKKCSYEKYEDLFLTNCVEYIKEQLKNISSLADKNAVQTILSRVRSDSDTLIGSVETYKKEIASSAQSIGTESMVKLQDYFEQITSCDLTNDIFDASPRTEPLGIY